MCSHFLYDQAIPLQPLAAQPTKAHKQEHALSLDTAMLLWWCVESLSPLLSTRVRSAVLFIVNRLRHYKPSYPADCCGDEELSLHEEGARRADEHPSSRRQL